MSYRIHSHFNYFPFSFPVNVILLIFLFIRLLSLFFFFSSILTVISLIKLRLHCPFIIFYFHFPVFSQLSFLCFFFFSFPSYHFFSFSFPITAVLPFVNSHFHLSFHQFPFSLSFLFSIILSLFVFMALVIPLFPSPFPAFR